MIHDKRVFQLKSDDEKPGPVIYWMNRDQRVDDNWALLHAQEIALLKRKYLLPLFSASFLSFSVRDGGTIHLC